MIHPIVLKRLKAFAIDYLVILLYIGMLLGFTFTLANIFSLDLKGLNPATGQMIGFLTLTLPVILYFTISEVSNTAATIGKKKMRLKVLMANDKKAGPLRLLLRNCLKFLPWEFAHFFVFHLVSFARNNMEAPDWIIIGLIGSQLLALLYLLWLFVAKQSLYELLSGTKVVQSR